MPTFALSLKALAEQILNLIEDEVCDLVLMLLSLLRHFLLLINYKIIEITQIVCSF